MTSQNMLLSETRDPDVNPPRAASTLILDMLTEGMNCSYEQVKDLSVRAMRVFCPDWFVPHPDDEECPIFGHPIRHSRKTVLDGTGSWQSARPDVIRVLRELLRIEHMWLNRQANDVVAALPDDIIHTLVRDLDGTDITPRHCERLLEAIDCKRGWLNGTEVTILMRLQRRPEFESQWPLAERLVLKQWAMMNGESGVSSPAQNQKRTAG